MELKKKIEKKKQNKTQKEETKCNFQLTTPENTITYHNALSLSPPKFCISIVFGVSWGHCNSQEKLKTMLMQNFGVTNKERYGMLWYFLEWSIDIDYTTT